MIAFAKPPGTSTPRTADELLAEFRTTGAQPPFEELVRRYAAMVFAECYSVTKSRHDAEDAAQAAFLTLAVQARTGDEIRHLGPWLQRVARRVALDQQKAKRRRKKREDNHHIVNRSSGEATPHRESMDQLELRHAMNEELQQLPAKYRMPLILHYFGGLTREQMAAELKCKPATLGVRLFRARDMLGKRLAKRGIALPAVAIPIAIGMVVRESVENHGVMAMIASAPQIAEAASRMAAGMPVGHWGVHSGVSAATLSLVETASHDLVMRKVKALIAAAAIGASALAAGGAQVVHKIADGTISLPSWRSVFSGFETPSVPRLKIEVTKTLVSDATPPSDWPSALRLEEGPGRLELSRVTLSNAALDVPRGYSVFGSALSLASLELPKAAIGSGATGSAGEKGRAEQVAQGTPPVSAKVEADAAKKPAVVAPADAGKAAVYASTEGEEPAPSFAGAGGGGGFGSGIQKFALGAVPPLSGRTSFSGATASYATSPSNYTSSDNVLRGYGKVAVTAVFENNGMVIADGYGTPATLDLSSAASVTNTVVNPPTGLNGWYARAAGKLTLPSLAVTPGTSTVTWGDDAAAATPDLVNAAKITFHGVKAAGNVSISLLAADRAEVPQLPSGYQALTVWSLSGAGDVDSLDVVARYAATGGAMSASMSGLGLFYVDANGTWKSTSATIDVSRRLISAAGIPDTEMLALLTASGKTLALDGTATAADLSTDALLNALIGLDAIPTEPIYSASQPVFTGESLLAMETAAFAPTAGPSFELTSDVGYRPPVVGVGTPGVVPEPTGVMAVLGMAVGLLSRRRR